MTAGATGGQPGNASGARPGIPGQPNQPGRPAIPGQPGQPGGQPVAYKAPAAFIPGQNNRNPNQQGVNIAGLPAAQPAANNPVQIGMQPGQVTTAGATDAQVQLNNMLNNNAGGVAQPTVIPNNGNQNGNQQPRRRVVLPTTP